MKSSAIEKELLDLPFPHPVKTKACEVLEMLDVKAVPRDKNRSKIKCYCLFQAYNELEYLSVPDPTYIGEKLGLTSVESSSAINTRPKYKIGLTPKSVTRTPQAVLRSFLDDRMPVPGDIKNRMMNVFTSILEANPNLLAERTKPLVAGYIVAYADMASLCVPICDIETAMCVRASEIRRITKLLQEHMAKYM